MDNERKNAYLVLMDVDEKKAYSNLALNHHLKRAKASTHSTTRRMVYGVLENKLYLDYVIDQLLENKEQELASAERNLLRLGIYQIAFMDDIPSYAAVSETVSLAKQYKKGMEGFVNAILRNYMRKSEEISLPSREDDESLYLSIKYSYEKWIVDMWLEEYGSKFTEELLMAGNKVPLVNVRPNPFRVGKKELARRLEDEGFHVEEGRLSKMALRVGGQDLLSTDLYERGMFSIQDESSMVVVETLDPQPDELIFDVCAAPGGKTMYIAEKMKNQGMIIARDKYRKKLDLIENEASRLGIEIVKPEVWDAANLDSQSEEMADRVLVDAPCSGLGIVRRKPEIKYKKKEDIEGLPEIQERILLTSSNYVKKGGTLVYSTCTINPKENAEVIKKFLKAKEDFVKIDEMQLLPNINDTDGFYICKMIRR